MGDGYQEVQEVISIHAPTRGATIIFQMSLSRTLFQSTLPREERRKKQSYNVRNRQFQSTLPREERLNTTYDLCNECIFQSTLPREERLSPTFTYANILCISIHAPTRGATYSHISNNEIRAKFISIHAPTRGATEYNLRFMQ